jgi:hypothetical protein
VFEPFDIFRVCGDDQPFWVDTVQSLDRAQARVEEFGVTHPGEYLVYCHGSGEQISMMAGERAED